MRREAHVRFLGGCPPRGGPLPGAGAGYHLAGADSLSADVAGAFPGHSGVCGISGRVSPRPEGRDLTRPERFSLARCGAVKT